MGFKYSSILFLLVFFTNSGNIYGTDQAPGNRDKEFVKKVSSFTDKILDNIYKARHASLIDKIIKLDSNELNSMQYNILKKLNEDYSKLKREDLNTKYKVIAPLKSHQFKHRLVEALNHQKSTDTIAVLVDKGSIAIAGNIKTRKIDDFGSLDLWYEVAQSTPLTSKVSFSYEDYSFTDSDLIVINKMLQSGQGLDWVRDGNYKVEVVSAKDPTPFEERLAQEVENDVKAKITQQKELETGKIENARKKLIEIEKKTYPDTPQVSASVLKKADMDKIPTEEKIRLNTQEIIEREKPVWAAKATKKYTEYMKIMDEARFHAEVQLLKRLEQMSIGGNPMEKVLIIPSKSPCEKCEAVLKQKPNIDFGKDAEIHGLGLESDNVRNWDDTTKFTIEIRELTNELAQKIQHSLDDNSEKPTKDVDAKPPGSCGSRSRRKRGVGSGSGACAFYFSESIDTDKARVKTLRTLDGIDSKNFISEYIKVGNQDRRVMTEIAETHVGKITGERGDKVRLQQLVEYEKMQKHNAKVKYISETSKSGEFFGESIRDKVGGYSEPELLKDTQLSPSKTSLFLSKHPKLQKGIKNAGKVSGTLGKFLMAKSVVTGIVRGDTTSLAIMGGRIGGEVFLETVGKYGSKFAGKLATKVGTKVGVRATAMFASSGLKILGKAAGPIGSVVDIGLSAWQLGKAINRLNDPNATKFEQNEAVADIVQESLDIAITATVTVISIAIPPLAPLVAVIGFFTNLLIMAAVTLYKAINHVNNLDSQVKLLDYERDAEVGRYVTGQDTSPYLKNLIRTKTANNIIVNATIKFLDENPDHIGLVIPSRTFDFQAGCKLEGAHCTLHSLGCWRWGETVTISSSCFEGGECSGSSEKCISLGYINLPYSSNYDWYKCDCSQVQNVQLGNPHPDSKVDLREKQVIYRDRSAPNELRDRDGQGTYDMFCYPSTRHSGGDFRSERDYQYGYLCENAIGLRRRSGSGKYLHFDLGDGNDEIYLDPTDTTSHRFTVGDGMKKYYGSLGEDTFLISGPCDALSGTLHGNGGGGDTLVLGQECGKGQTMNIDFGSGYFGHDSSFSKKNELKLLGISNYVGRAGEADYIAYSCGVKYVDGAGGKNIRNPDVIELSKHSRCDTQTLIVAQNFTTINLAGILGETKILLPKDSRHVIVNHLEPATDSPKVIFYFKAGVSEFSSISAQTLNNIGYTLKFEVGRGEAVAEISMRLPRNVQFEPAELLFENNESNAIPTRIFVDESLSLLAVHRLENIHNSTREGASVIPNYFELISGTGTVRGGELDDEFVLKGGSFSGIIEGHLGENTLKLDGALGNESIVVDLRKQLVWNRIRALNIHRLVGRPLAPEIIHTDCSTTFVAGNGGGDKITVSSDEAPCSNPLSVLTKGVTHLRINGTRRPLHIFLASEPHVQLSSELTSNGGKEPIIYTLDFPCSSVSRHYSTNHEHGFTLSLKSDTSQEFNFALTVTKSFKIDDVNEHWELPTIQFQEGNGSPSLLFISRATPAGKLLGYHSLNQSGTASLARHGFPTISNYFQISGENLIVQGGKLDDTFEVQSDSISGSLDGLDGTNTLILNGKKVMSSAAKFNLAAGTLTFLRDPSKVLKLKNLQRVFARRGVKDVISPSCATRLIAGNGGSPSQPDTINISNVRDCNFELTVITVGTTHIQIGDNPGSIGSIQLFVQDDPQGRLGFSYYKSTLEEDLHVLVVLNFEPSEIVDADYNLAFQRYTLKLKLRNNGSVQFDIPVSTSTDRHDGFISNPNIPFVPAAGRHESNLLIRRSDGFPVVHHMLNLSNVNSMTKCFGAMGISNQFKMSNGKWELHGGSKDDTFIFLSDQFSGTLSGGTSGTNMLVLQHTLQKLITVDLERKWLSVNGVKIITLANIQLVHGQHLHREIIHSGVETVAINGAGGESENSYDEIIIASPAILAVSVPKFTAVKNSASHGNFTYLIEEEKDFTISVQNPELGCHRYKFQFGIQHIKAAELNVAHHILTLQTHLNNTLEIKMRADLSNPKVQFMDSESGIWADVILERPDNIHTSIKITSTLAKPLIGIRGVINNFLIEMGTPNSRITYISGSDLDANFWISSVGRIYELDGGNGSLNALNLMDSLFQDEPLVVDLRLNGYVFRTRAQDVSNEDVEPGVKLIDALKNIQILRGRPSAYERVYIGCDTHFVSHVEEVWFTRTDCTNENITISVGPNTQVHFRVPDDHDHLGATFSPAIVNYRFQVPQSFDYIFDHWFEIRAIQHFFYFSFNLKELEKLYFVEGEKALTYVLSNTTYTHQVDPFLDPNQEFFANPNFVLKDGSRVQVFRNCGILITLGSPKETDSVQELFQVADKLSATILAQMGSSFLYIGNSGASAECPNILTNSISNPSILYGAGSQFTLYLILDLQKNVIIYSGNFQEGSNTTQIIDLSEIVWVVRNQTQTKYVPTLHQNLEEDSMEIVMTGFERDYPGIISIQNWSASQGHFEVLLNSVYMEIHPLESPSSSFERKVSNTRFRRDVTQQAWHLVPKPLIMKGGVVSVAAADLETGMKILSNDGMILFENNSTFELATRETDLFITNMLDEYRNFTTTLILLEYFQGSGQNRTQLNEFEVSINLGNVELELNETRRMEVLASISKDWDDILDESEESILQGLHEVERQFKIPPWTKSWKRHFYAMIALSVIIGVFLLIIILLVATKVCVKWRRVMNVTGTNKKDLSKHDSIELKTMKKLLTYAGNPNTEHESTNSFRTKPEQGPVLVRVRLGYLPSTRFALPVGKASK